MTTAERIHVIDPMGTGDLHPFGGYVEPDEPGFAELLAARSVITEAGLSLHHSELVPQVSSAVYLPPDDQRPGAVLVAPDLAPAAEQVALHVALSHHRLGHRLTSDPERWAAEQRHARRTALGFDPPPGLSGRGR